MSVESVSPNLQQLSSGSDKSVSIIPASPLLPVPVVQRPVWQNAAKRAIDMSGAGLGLVFLSPAFLVLGLLVKTTSKGPVFFAQTRVGEGGRLFTLYKFRTMVPDAEQRKSELETLNEASGPVFKIKRDPRVTPVGRVLRKYSLDELPQLINVLRGDMSLVGPRPPLLSEVNKYEPWQVRRLSTKPGLTCTWQVSGRSNISFEDWMRMDLEYIDNWGLAIDFKLLLKTIKVVVTGHGAY